MISHSLLAQTPVLEPVRTSITVVEKITTEAPASISVISRDEIREIPGVNLDDRLRSVPGFSLFRRTSSLIAHPTTQGVSLRGISSTGASRTLVLWDGIPINDPFGGWVYWTRMAPEEVERVEISRGASVSVFGDRSLGGAIALFSRQAEPMRLSAGYEAGNKNTHEVTLGFSHLWRRVAVSGFGRAFTTDGYFIIPEDRRGSVDQQANVRFVTGDARVDFFGVADRLFLKMDVLAEERENGTLLQRNSSGLGTVAGHYTREHSRDTFSVLGFHTREQFRSTFSAIPANRNSETLTFLQTVPSEALGGAAFWKHGESRWNVLAGADVQRVEAVNTDRFITPPATRVGGGTLLQHGWFGQIDGKLSHARFFLGARQHFAGNQGRFFSPTTGFAAGRGWFRARGSVYRGFRTPTLNELYREFRVGTAVTQANPDLKAEKLFGAEAGVDILGEQWRIHVTFFRNELAGLITNVTLSTTPALTLRQRRNAADALSRGFETEIRHRWKWLETDAAYLFVDSRYTTGERVPQVPRHQGSAQVTWTRGGAMLSAGFRSFSAQFEDDRNQFLLAGYATVHFAARRHITRGLSAVLQAENLLDREYPTGLSAATVPRPLFTIGAPRLWRAGLRWEGRLR